MQVSAKKASKKAREAPQEGKSGGGKSGGKPQQKMRPRDEIVPCECLGRFRVHWTAYFAANN